MSNEPSEKELKQAVRLLRHIESCMRTEGRCDLHFCYTGLEHYGAWSTTYYNEVLGEEVNAK